MTVHASTVRDLPDALHDEGLFFERLAGRRPAVFLDYDGVLTPIVDRPEDAVISKGMRTTVRALARRCPVCVVSGRDRQVVQELMGVDDLVVAGSHGFDIWSPSEGTIAHDAGSGYEDLISDATDVVPLYLGDDITDEDAFRALRGLGVGIIVGHAADPEVADRATAADFLLASTVEVEQFLSTLAR